MKKLNINLYFLVGLLYILFASDPSVIFCLESTENTIQIDIQNVLEVTQGELVPEEGQAWTFVDSLREIVDNSEYYTCYIAIACIMIIFIPTTVYLVVAN